MKQIIFFVTIVLISISCTSNIVSWKKPYEDKNLKLGRFHFVETENNKFYGKIDSISKEKIFLTDKKKNLYEIEKSKIVKIKKYSIGKTIAYPILGYATLTAAVLILITNGIAGK